MTRPAQESGPRFLLRRDPELRTSWKSNVPGMHGDYPDDWPGQRKALGVPEAV